MLAGSVKPPALAQMPESRSAEQTSIWRHLREGSMLCGDPQRSTAGSTRMHPPRAVSDSSFPSGNQRRQLLS